MSDSLFRPGGPHNIRRTGRDTYSMSVALPVDSDGLSGRECPTNACSPAYFKVKIGTGITEGQAEAFCPYCRHCAEPDGFFTAAQIEYAKNLALREAHKGVNRMVEEAFGLGPSHRRKIGGGLVSMEMKYTPGSLPHVDRPIEEELRRDVTCPHCGLAHAVFGLATWCPDCGKDIFLVHVSAELLVIEQMLGDVARRQNELGSRVAARDVENALEDTVSIFEAVLRAMTRRSLIAAGKSVDEVEQVLKRQVANRYQNVELAAQTCRELLRVDLFEGVDEGVLSAFQLTFEKRHPIAHNLGIIDRKYLEKVRSGELVGRDVPVTSAEIASAIEVLRQVMVSLHARLFPA